ncbi:unnamed protein product [Oikopleura dioica]|uniref:Uncharacterized protein n=1 Tax=Oikopleura dioica TaxID=34765 RepID=E4XEB6_OIKDI|nr:unnamed protein product [Oikopleura dioica]
MTGDFYVHKQ